MIQQIKIENLMRRVRIDRVVLSCGATEQNLEKSRKLLELLSGKKPQKIVSRKRIPNFGVRPGLEVGARVTLRGKEAFETLKKLLGAINNTLSEGQITQNAVSFGIHEYIEIPNVEYQRDIGIRGLNVTAVFSRGGFRVKNKKIKGGKLPKKQYISPEEIIQFMEENFDTEIE